MFAATIFSHQFQRFIIYDNEEHRRLEREGYQHVGMIIPLTMDFYTKQQLDDCKFVLLRQHPWTLIDRFRDGDTKQTNAEYKCNRNGCMLDTLLFTINLEAYKEALGKHSKGLRKNRFAYWGCIECWDKIGHIVYPWHPFLGKIDVVGSRTISHHSRVTFLSAMHSWAKLAEKDEQVRKIHIYMMISTLVAGYFIYKYGDNNVKQAMESKNKNAKLNPSILKFLGLNNIQQTIRNDYYGKESNPLVFSIDYECKLEDIKEELAQYDPLSAPLFVKMTTNLGIGRPTTDDYNFFKPTVPMKKQQVIAQQLFPKTYVTTNDLDQIPIQQV